MMGYVFKNICKNIEQNLGKFEGICINENIVKLVKMKVEGNRRDSKPHPDIYTIRQ